MYYVSTFSKELSGNISLCSSSISPALYWKEDIPSPIIYQNVWPEQTVSTIPISLSGEQLWHPGYSTKAVAIIRQFSRTMAGSLRVNGLDHLIISLITTEETMLSADALSPLRDETHLQVWELQTGFINHVACGNKDVHSYSDLLAQAGSDTTLPEKRS